MKRIVWFISQSLELDVRFFFGCHWTIRKKIRFLLLKYWLIFKHSIIPFRLFHDYCVIDGKRFYYDTKYGLAGLQGVYVRHAHLFSFMKTKKVRTIVDIGANVGYVSHFLHEKYPKAVIHAFEPIPLTFACLKNNINYPGVSYVNNSAITDKSGNLKMEFNEKNCAESHISTKGSTSVKTETLDTYVGKHNIRSINILKIDTEGFEDTVLDGGKKALSITDYIYMEVTMWYNPRYTISQLLGKLYSKNFNYQLVAMRNFANLSEGEVPIMDCLFVNVNRMKKI